MGKLAFYRVRIESELVEKCGRHVAESVAHDGVTVVTKVSQSSINSVVGHATRGVSHPGKNIFSVSSERLQIAEDSNCLLCERYDMRLSAWIFFISLR